MKSHLDVQVSQKFGVEEGEIHSALLSDDPHNALVIAYNLVIDNRRIESAKEKEDFKQFYSSGSGQAPAQEGSGHKPHPERIAPLRDKPVTPVEKTHRGAPIKRSKWHLGIRSQSKPHDIMSEVYRAMKTLDFEWKVINPYHVQVCLTIGISFGSLRSFSGAAEEPSQCKICEDVFAAVPGCINCTVTPVPV